MSAYMLSEKLDGCHVYWTGHDLVSRSRRTIACPGWFIAGLPAEPFEAELYAGPGTLNRVQGLVRRKWRNATSEGWEDLRLHLFDLPRHYLEPFPEVYNRMMALDLPGHCSVIPQTLTDSEDRVRSEFQRVVDRGGEGLCLRETSGTYHLTKLKPGTVERRLIRCFAAA